MKLSPINRRNFIAGAGAAVATAPLGKGRVATAAHPRKLYNINTPIRQEAEEEEELPFKISLAEWSLHRTIRKDKTMTNMDFPRVAREEFGIGAIEYVNSFFKDKAFNRTYLSDLKTQCDDHNVQSLLIMCDGEGRLGDPNQKKRTQAVENHFKWVTAAWFLGCHSIRVNAASGGEYEEQVKLAADGLSQLSEFAAQYGLNVVVENHGGLSSNGEWLSKVIKSVGMDNCGTLPDFGNFRIRKGEMYDRYKGVTELMPFAKAVSAKSHEFDADGNEVNTDYMKMMKIVLNHGYNGWVGIEWEGGGVSEFEGVKLTKALLERCQKELAQG